MAEHYKVQFGVSLTPAITIGASQAVATSAMDVEIAKSLGGSGIVGDTTAGDNVTMLADGEEVTGFESGAPIYVSSNGSSGNGLTVTDTNNIVFIKNTGFEYSSPSALGDALTKTAGVWTTAEAIEIKDTNDSGVVIARLYPGEAIVLPRAGASVVFHCSSESGAGNIAVEYAIINDGT